MRKTLKALIVGLAATGLLLSSCGKKDDPVNPDPGPVVVVTLNSISIAGYTTAYNVGDTFSFNGTVSARYSDNSVKTVQATSVSTPDMTTVGTKEVVVSYTEGGVTKTASYNIVVSNPLNALAATGVKTAFNFGEQFSLGSDAVVTATFHDGSSKNVTAQVTNNNPDMSTAGTKEVVLSYTEGGITKTCSYNITVTAVLDSISASGYTANYVIGQTFAFDGVVTAHYNDGSELTVTPTSISSPDMSTKGAKTVTITYLDETCDITINVNAELDDLSISGQTTSYYQYDVFSFDGVATAHYSDGDSHSVTPSSVTNPDMTVAGDKEITVAYSEGGISKSASYTISVVALEISSLAISGQKLDFFVDDAFSFGGTIKATYNNGVEVDLTESDVTITAPDMSSAGVKEVTVSYTDAHDIQKAVSYNITVAAVVVDSLSVSDYVEEFWENDDFEFGGLAVATYNNGVEVDVDESDLDITAPDMSSAGTKTVNVSFTDETGTASTSYNITVKHDDLSSVEALYMSTNYYVGDSFSFDGKLIASYISGNSHEVAATSVSAPDMSSAGVKVITVSYTEDGITKSTEYSINVIALPDPTKTYTYNDYLTISPSNWNELTYQDNNDTNILSPISGGLFTFDYKYDESYAPVPGAYTVQYDGATALEDVTAVYAGDPKYSVPEDAESGFAYKITLRNDLKWDDGTPINADTFVYTMKEQLNPDFLNYRADSFYGGSGTVIHNAERYLKQGQSGVFSAKGVFNGVYDESEDNDLIWDSYFNASDKDESAYLFSWFRSINGSGYDSYMAEGSLGIFTIGFLYGGLSGSYTDYVALAAQMNGKTFAEIKADATMKAAWDEYIGWWQTEPGEELDFFITNYTFPLMEFEEVGFFKGASDNEIVLVLDKTLNLLNEDGTLSYKAAYNMASLPLVKPDLYESCKIAPATPDGLWTSNYNTSVETSASWGPYKLTSFQAGKQFILERNDQWYGYNMNQYKGQYQTTKIVTDIYGDWNTAWLAFQQGDVGLISIDVSIADDYKASSRGRFTPSDFISSLQLQSSTDSLHEREAEGEDKDILGYVEFREALSLCIDRADYAAKVTTASKAGLGLFNSMHYIAVDEGLVYRETDEAKLAICEAYGVDPEDYDTLDEAYAACTGYNLTLAREKLEEAYAACKADGLISDTDVVRFVVGASEITESVQRQFDYLEAAFANLAEGTSLNGRLELVLDDSFGTKWATDFMDGAYDICTGAWTGAAWDPCYLISAYIDPNTAYSASWDTSEVPMTYNPWHDDDPEHNLTLSLMDWYECLNGLSEIYPWDWSEGNVETSFRVGILAQLEKAVLKAYYSVPIVNAYSAALVSYKFVANFNYNTFMGYGGTRYLKYAYDDAAWELVKDTFDYRD